MNHPGLTAFVEELYHVYNFDLPVLDEDLNLDGEVYTLDVVSDFVSGCSFVLGNYLEVFVHGLRPPARVSGSWLGSVEGVTLSFGWLDFLPVLPAVITTSTTTSVVFELPPNAGLFPTVMPVDGETFGRMAITNSELATLQEYGVSRTTRQRLDEMLQAFDRHEQQGTGPESRWALERLVRRVGEGADAQQAILQVLRRRLVPRGLLPVTRVPRVEQQRWNIFTWVRQYVSLFLEELDTHLRTPLQPVETNRSSSSEDDGREHSRSRSRSRSRPRSPAGSLRSPEDVSLHSDWAINSEGEEVHVPDAEPGTPQRGPPPPDPVQWAPVSLQGIWREPEPEPTQEHDPDASSSSRPRTSTMSTTSTTSTTSSKSSTTSTTGIWVNILENQTVLGGDPAQSVSSLPAVVMPSQGVAMSMVVWEVDGLVCDNEDDEATIQH